MSSWAQGGPGRVEDRLEAGESVSWGEAALRMGASLGVSFAGKLFLLLLERRRLPGGLAPPSSLSFLPSPLPWRPPTVAGKSAPRTLVLVQRCAQGPPRGRGGSGLGVSGPVSGLPQTPRVRTSGCGGIGAMER